MPTLRSRIISGVYWLAATKALSQAVTWVLTLAVVRLLSPNDYGLMGMAVLVTGFLLLFNEVGLGAAIVQHRDLDERHLCDLRWAILLVNIGLFLLLVALAPLVAAWFEEPALTTIVRVLASTFVINGIGAASMFMLQREMAFDRKSKAELVGNVLGGVGTFAAALAGLGVWSLVLGYLAQQATVNGMYCWYRPIPFRVALSIRNVAPFVNFGLQVASAKVLWFASSNADFAIVGRVLGSTALGYYNLAFQFSSLPIEKIVSIVTQVAFPSFAALQQDRPTLQRYYLKLVSSVALVTFPMFLGLFLVADSAVQLFLTDKWTPVVLPLQVLCVVSCIRAVETMNSPLLLAMGRPQIAVRNNLLQLVVMLPAFYIGAQYGLVGVSIAWLITWPILYAIVTAQTLALIELPVSAYARALGHAVVSSVVMVAVVIAVQRSLLTTAPAAVELVLSGVLGCGLYLGYHWFFNRAAVLEALATIHPTLARTAAATTAADAAIA
jgi:O-antigen/teichoic acid export membrane protein